MKTIAFYLPVFLNYSETFIYNLAKNLGGFKLIILCRQIKNLDRFPFENVFQVNSKRQLRQVLQQQNVCLIHAQYGTFGADIMNLAKKLNIALITHFRGQDAYQLAEQFFIRLTYRQLFQKSAKILTVSQHMKNHLINLGCPADKISVYYGGINLPQFKPDKKIGRKIKIVLAGRLTEKKGFDLGIKAIKQLHDSGFEISAQIIGSGSLDKQLQELINHYHLQKSIQLVGQKSSKDLQAALYRADILLAPHYQAKNGDSEGIPNVLKEAMACGTVVVSTTHSGIPELITDQQSGFLAKENDLTQLVAKIKEAINCPHLKTIRQKAREKVEQNFDIQKQIVELEKIYWQILGNNSKLAVILPNSLPIPPIKGGSIQTVVYDVLQRLHGFEIQTYSKATANLPTSSIDRYGIRHNYIKDRWFNSLEIETKNGFLIRYNRYIYKIIRQLKKFKPQIIHVHNRPHYLPIIRRHFPQTTLIYTGHNLKIAEDSYNLKRIEQIAGSLDQAIYCSNKVGELDLWQNHPQYKSKVATIYNSVDTQKFLPRYRQDPKIIRQLRQKYNLVNKKVVLFVGRLVAEKAAHNVLQAMKLIKTQAVLLIVGSSFFEGARKTDYIRQLEKIAVKDQVVFTGFVKPEQMPYIYALADVFVSPVNWDDPSPKTIYEAAACQLPIIATQRGGIPEIVGQSAILLKTPYSDKLLADKIDQVLNDNKLARQLGKSARQRMLANFTTEKIAQQWQDSYQKLL